MEHYGLTSHGDGRPLLRVPYRGTTLLRHPLYTKGTAFTVEERAAFGLEALLPSAVSTMDQQARRAYANVMKKPDDLERYIGLAALQDRNEHLFYRVLGDHLEELLPIVYTPTVGRACQEWSRIFRRARGMWITPGHRGRIDAVLGAAPFDDVRLIVVTDNERILGLGDQGAGGMGIPIGKLAVYVAAAGIHPAQTLPISLDVGTDNPALLEDDLYLGWRFPRLRGHEYETLVEEFVQAVVRRFPKAILQWEDFKKGNAFRLLDRYRRTLPSFNDDIQGTSAVAVAAMLAATRVTGVAPQDQRVVILGGGAAGIGIARLLRQALAHAGLQGDGLRRAIAVLDSGGLLVEGRGHLEAYKGEFTWTRDMAAAHGLAGGSDLLSVVRAVKPTVLLGTSGQPGAFPEAVVREMARHVERPVVLPMSNPTSKTEARPEDVLAWTDGRALVATGSPFPAVRRGDETVTIAQANNAFVFPGIGLGSLVSGAFEITDAMFMAAAERLARETSAEDLAAGALFPPVSALRRVTARVAEAVVRAARDSGVGRAIEDDEILAAVLVAMWTPRYPALEPEKAAVAPEVVTAG
jgi:malic enzyme